MLPNLWDAIYRGRAGQASHATSASLCSNFGFMSCCLPRTPRASYSKSDRCFRSRTIKDLPLNETSTTRHVVVLDGYQESQDTLEGCGCFLDFKRSRRNLRQAFGATFSNDEILQIVGFQAPRKANLLRTMGRHWNKTSPHLLLVESCERRHHRTGGLQDAGLYRNGWLFLTWRKVDGLTNTRDWLREPLSHRNFCTLNLKFESPQKISEDL